MSFVKSCINSNESSVAINYIWRVYWYVFPSTPRIYRKFLWLWKYWVRNVRRSFFQQLNSFFQEVNLIFQLFNFNQKFFLLHVNLFLFIPAFPALHTSFSRIAPNVMYEKPQTLRMRRLSCNRFAICHTFVLEFVTPLTITLLHMSFVKTLH